MKEIERLVEAMQGVISEQKALQGYAVDFVDAYNEKDLGTMLKAARGSLVLQHLFLKEFEDVPGMSDVLRTLNKLVDQMESVDVKRDRRSHRRA